MALTYCESCRATEGRTKEIEIDDYKFITCAECDCGEEISGLPEHDDLEDLYPELYTPTEGT